MPNWEDAKRAAQSPFHDGPRGGELRSVTAAEPSQKLLTEHQALGLAIRAIEEVPDHLPKFVAGLRQAYERGVQNEKLREVAPELLEALKSLHEIVEVALDEGLLLTVGGDRPDLRAMKNAAAVIAKATSEQQPEREATREVDIEPDL